MDSAGYSLPGTCTVGDRWLLQSSPFGHYHCETTNVWIQDGPGSAPGSIPAGLICMWGGLLINIPSGWNLCDGTLGTPDLRSMFIKGAAAGIDPGATGGASTHTHAFTGSSANTSLVSAGTPAGTNSTSTVTPTGTVAWPAGVPTFAGSALGTHTHTFTASSNAASPKLMTVNTSSGNAASGTTGATSAGTPAGTVAWPAGVPTFSGGSNTVGAQTFTGSALGTHQHALTATGTNANASSEPAYYSLAFIQKA